MLSRYMTRLLFRPSSLHTAELPLQKGFLRTRQTIPDIISLHSKTA